MDGRLSRLLFTSEEEDLPLPAFEDESLSLAGRAVTAAYAFSASDSFDEDCCVLTPDFVSLRARRATEEEISSPSGLEGPQSIGAKQLLGFAGVEIEIEAPGNPGTCPPNVDLDRAGRVDRSPGQGTNASRGSAETAFAVGGTAQNSAGQFRPSFDPAASGMHNKRLSDLPLPPPATRRGSGTAPPRGSNPRGLPRRDPRGKPKKDYHPLLLLQPAREQRYVRLERCAAEEIVGIIVRRGGD